jgi:eukaryotic-like serine/threonine-protein kinase
LTRRFEWPKVNGESVRAIGIPSWPASWNLKDTADPMRGEYDDRIAVREGDVLADKYRVERVLGTGGMGIVVAARHLRLQERVAIKFLHPDALSNAEAVARFEREARAAAKIKSEHVARVSDVGTLDNGCPYMIMEYLEGEDLANWLQQRGPLAIDQAVEFILQTCEAMAEAHGLGIVHRDLKPANLFCIRRTDGLPSIKVLDFGISKIDGPGLDITHAGAVMGSPLYMSPEQMVSARSVDARTDIWALGVILYELISGRGPFTGENLPEVCMSIARQPTPSLRATRPDTPPNLDAVIAKCLQKDRKKRYSNVAELAVALAPFAPKRAKVLVDRISRVIESAGLSESALALPPSSNPASARSGPATMASWGQTDARNRRHRAGLVGIAAAIGLGVGAIAATWALQKSAPDTTTPSLDAEARVASPHVLVSPVPPEAPAAAVSTDPPVAPAPSASSSALDVVPASPSTRPEPVRNSRPAPARAPAAAVAPRAPHSAPASVPKAAAPPAASSDELGGRL